MINRNYNENCHAKTHLIKVNYVYYINLRIKHSPVMTINYKFK